MPFGTVTGRREMIRRILRDVDTNRQFFTDAELSEFSKEAVYDWEAVFPANQSGVTATFTATGLSSRIRGVLVDPVGGGYPSALASAVHTAFQTRLDIKDFWHIRYLQEREGRTGPATMAGVIQSTDDLRAYNLAVYPISAQQVTTFWCVFSGGQDLLEASDSFIDHRYNESMMQARIAAVRLAAVAGASNSDLVRIAQPLGHQLRAAMGIRIDASAPGEIIDDARTHLISARGTA